MENAARLEDRAAFLFGYLRVLALVIGR